METLEWKPKFSHQKRGEKNCGQHCVAMITGLPVDIVSQFLKNNKGTKPSEVAGALRWFGYYCDVKMNKYQGSLPDLCILHVASHWCVYYKGTIYDSCLGIFSFQEKRYRIKNYLTVKLTA